MAAFYIQNPWTGLVIDIGENAQKPSPGWPLRANTKMTSAPGNAYQLWTFSGPYEPVSGHPTTIPYYWLQNANTQSPLVIDIAESGNVISAPGRPDTLKQGSPLDAFTNKGNDATGPDSGLTGGREPVMVFRERPSVRLLHHFELLDRLRYRYRGRREREGTYGRQISRRLAVESLPGQ